jgi:hypothetical protein
MTVQTFLTDLGGTAKVARELGIPLTTVATWAHRNKVPQWRLASLAALAVAKGVEVPAHFRELAA